MEDDAKYGMKNREYFQKSKAPPFLPNDPATYSVLSRLSELPNCVFRKLKKSAPLRLFFKYETCQPKNNEIVSNSYDFESIRL